MPTDPAEHLRGLTPLQCRILYWVCRGLQYRDIAKRVDLSKRAVQYHMTQIYGKLKLDGFEREEARARLFQIYCPILRKQIDDPEKDCERFWPPEEPVVPLESAPGFVEEEEEAERFAEREPPMERYEEGDRISRLRWLLAGLILGGLSTLLVIAGIFVILGRIPREVAIPGMSTPTEPVAAQTVPLPTDTPRLEAPVVAEASVTRTELVSATATPSPSPTHTPTHTAAPSHTPTSIPAPPTATATPSIYQVGDKAYLAPDVFFTLSDELDRNYLCDSYGYMLQFSMENRSSRQFVARFEGDRGFGMQDDEGRIYELLGASLTIYCDPGLHNVIVDPGEDRTFRLYFAGDIPPSAQYLIITIDDISGAGPFVFRKDL